MPGIQTGSIKQALAANDFTDGRFGKEPYLLLIMGSAGYVNVYGVNEFAAYSAKNKGTPFLPPRLARDIIEKRKRSKP